MTDPSPTTPPARRDDPAAQVVPTDPPPLPSPTRPVVPLDYVRPMPRAPLVDPILARRRVIGAVRQAALAAGLMLFAGGLGATILRHVEGAFLMTAGAGLFGLALPVRRGDRFW